jgi:cellulose synthase (UDP-forming)
VRRRIAARSRALRALAWVGASRSVRGVVLDTSPGGLGALFLGRPPRGPLPVVLREGVRWARVAHSHRVLPGVWRAGLAYLPVSLPGDEAHEYLAA